MADRKAAKRYAKAIFDLAVETGQIGDVAADIGAYGELLNGSAEFAELVNDPVVEVERRTTMLRALFDGKANTISMQFLLLLCEKNRIGELSTICEEFQDLNDGHLGIMRVVINSATELSSEQVSNIEQRLQARFNKTVKSEVTVDPTLIGGFEVIAGDQVFDYSLKTQLATLKRNIINA
jgi:F-type H+-transporting ATPase subunit delta